MKTSMQTPRFLKAKTASSLERMMLENNLKRQAWHQYQISYADGSWYAWFYVDLSGVYNKEVEELTNGNEPGTGRQGAG